MPHGVIPIAGRRPLDGVVESGLDRERPAGNVSQAPRPPRWPIVALFVGYPISWAVGLGPLSLPLLAAVCLLWLLAHRKRLLAPAGFGIWSLFIVWVVLGFLTLDLQAPGTVGGGGSGALLAFVYRCVIYLSATALMVYVASTSEAEVPARMVLRCLSWLFVASIAGGYLGLISPDGGFTSPVERMLPNALAANDFVRDLTHPSYAQVQDVLGAGDPRPKAPYTYTNDWGAMVAYLLPVFVLDRLVLGSRKQRFWGGIVLALAVIPIVLSLNRGLWISIVVAAVVGMASLIRLRPRLLLPTGLIAAVGLTALLMSPLGGVLLDRASNEHSNSARGFIVVRAIEGSLAAPILGWGGPRLAEGNPDSRSTGASDQCEKCSPPSVGTHGQLWLVLFTNGIVGAALFCAFFVGWWFRLRAPTQPFGVLALIVVSLWLVQMFFYPGLPLGIHIVLLFIGLAARSSNEAGVPP